MAEHWVASLERHSVERKVVSMAENLAACWVGSSVGLKAAWKVAPSAEMKVVWKVARSAALLAATRAGPSELRRAVL